MHVDYALASLNLVKNEIGLGLQQVRQSLETYHQHPENANDLNQGMQHLHQIQGCFHMIGLHEAALLTSEMEQLAGTLPNKTADVRNSTMELLVSAVFRLPAYLELLQKGQGEQSAVLLPLINELRTARGEAVLPQDALFTPDLEAVERVSAAETPAKEAREAEHALIKKLRVIYLVALLKVMKNEDASQALKELQEVLAELDGFSGVKRLGQFWWVARALVESLQIGGTVNNTAKSLLGRIDQEIKRVEQDGISAFEKPGSPDVMKTMLRYLAETTAAGPLVLEVKQAFELDRMLPTQAALAEARERLVAPDSSVMKTVADVLLEEIIQVKDTLDVFMRGNTQDLTTLQTVEAKLQKIADTLRMLDLRMANQIVHTQLNHLKQILAKETTPTYDMFFEMARAIIFVESAVKKLGNQLQHQVKTDILSADESGSLMVYQKEALASELQEAEHAVLREAHIEINFVRDDIVKFVTNGWDHQYLKEVPKRMKHIIGSMQVLNMAKPVGLLTECLQYIEQELITKQITPAENMIEHLADAIASIEYYLECIEKKQGIVESTLEKAAESLRALQQGH